MIRRAELDDLAEVVALVGDFHTPGEWHGLAEFDPISFSEVAAGIIRQGVIFLSERGLIGLVLVPWTYNTNVTVAAECFFWAPDGRGDALLRAAEDWAADKADLISTSAHIPGEPRLKRIDRWFRRKGYLPMGLQYAKAVR